MPENFNYASLGLNITVGFCVFALSGHYLTQKTGVMWWELGGILSGFFYIGYEVWKFIRQLNS